MSGGPVVDLEGRQVAEWLNSLGVSAFVLQYRVGPRYRHPAPLQDGQRVDYFRADKAWWYITLLTIGYMIARGLAKSGSREPYDDDRSH